jgi:primosomal protein N' (replication factor Y) (superfamily II helicase)
VQAYAIEHPAITFAARHDYLGFAAQELQSRAAIGNPPFGHLALVRVHGLDEVRVTGRTALLGKRVHALVDAIAAKHAARGTAPPRIDVLGPVASPLQKINGKTRWQLLLRSEQRGPLRWLLTALRPGLGPQGTGTGQTTAIVDVDPQSFL